MGRGGEGKETKGEGKGEMERGKGRRRGGMGREGTPSKNLATGLSSHCVVMQSVVLLSQSIRLSAIFVYAVLSSPK